jgi:type II secretory pathway component PulM
MSSDSAARIAADPVTAEATSDKSAANLAENLADPCGRRLAIEALRRGPRGAIVLASIGVLSLLIIWYAFYLFAYLPRT